MVIHDSMLILAAALTAYVISYISMPALIKLAELKNRINTPDGKHRIENRIVPALGGIGVFFAFIISYSVWGQAVSMPAFPFFIASLFVLFLMGIKDGNVELTTFTKLLVQTTAILILVYGGRVFLSGFGGVFGVEDVSWLTGSLTTVVIMLMLTNAYNLVDGIDGLAGGIGVIVSTIFGIWFWGAGFLSYALLSFALSGALIGFLVFNMYPAKLYMGDTSTMSVGFVLGFLAIEFLTLNHALTNQSWHISNGEVLAVSILIVPIIYTLRLILIYLKRRVNLFEGKRCHFHHKILGIGITYHHAALMMGLFNILMIGLAYLTMQLNINIQLGIMIGVGMLMLPSIRLRVFVEQRLLSIKKSRTESARSA